jgi:hypothetical protein
MVMVSKFNVWINFKKILTEVKIIELVKHLIHSNLQ